MRSQILGIISDTHGHRANTLRAIRMLESLEVDILIHCGDIGSPALVELFSAWPTHFVFGNVDDDKDALRAAIAAAGQSCHERFGQLEIAGRKIAFLHGDDVQRLETTIAGGEYDLVGYGHTHHHEQHRVGGTLVLNPGALYRAAVHTIAVVRMPDLEATHVPL